jgi:hypothetical protein
MTELAPVNPSPNELAPPLCSWSLRVSRASRRGSSRKSRKRPVTTDTACMTANIVADREYIWPVYFGTRIQIIWKQYAFAFLMYSCSRSRPRPRPRQSPSSADAPPPDCTIPEGIHSTCALKGLFNCYHANFLNTIVRHAA